VPAWPAGQPELGPLQQSAKNLMVNIKDAGDSTAFNIEHFRFREAQQHMIEAARLGNQFLHAAEPWKKHKEDPESAAAKLALHTGIQVCGWLAALMEPFLPNKAKELADLLNLADGHPLRTAAWSDLRRDTLVAVDAMEDASKAGAVHDHALIAPGHRIREPWLLFQKLDAGFAEAELNKLAAARAAQAPAPAAPPLKETLAQFEDVEKLDLRVAAITAAEPVKKADKLLKITLDTGLDERIVVSGIAQHYAPAELIGQQVVLVANLAPKKLRGIRSEGMILMAETPEGALRFVQPAGDLPNGSIVR